jgi:hypothetical protein
MPRTKLLVLTTCLAAVSLTVGGCSGAQDSADQNCDFPDTWYEDVDNDGFGNADSTKVSCSQPDGYVSDGADCNDSDPTIQSLESWYPDSDGDGYGSTDDVITTCFPEPGFITASGDCNDSDAEIHYGANEVCDGVDNNCNGYVDDRDDTLDTSSMTPYYTDADDDGWGDIMSPVYGCTQPHGTSDNSDDCDDNDPTVGAPKPWYQDADADGYGNDKTAKVGCYPPKKGWTDLPGDCDETNPAVNPGADEICADYLDNDCDGDLSCYEGNMPLTDAYAEIIGEDTDVYLGCGLAGTGDVNGDGVGDFLVASEYASAALFYGPVSGEVLRTTANVFFTGTSYTVSSAGDQDGDGLEDMLFGNQVDGTAGASAGIVYLVTGNPTGTVDLETDAIALYGENAGDRAGVDLVEAGDMNDDGFTDFLVGAWWGSFSAGYSGGAYLVTGPVTASMSLGDAAARWSGSASNDYAGYSVDSAGDIDGDGVVDVVIGAPQFGSIGMAYIVSGAQPTGDLGKLGMGSITGANAGDKFGYSVTGLGDWDGDGLDDLMIGAPEDNYSTDSYGRAYVFLGPISGAVTTGSAYATFVGKAATSDTAACVSGPGDIDMDGNPDALIAAPTKATTIYTTGEVYLIFGPISGTFDLADSHAVFQAERANDDAGQVMEGIGDVNEDGFADFGIASPNVNYKAGAVYLWYGGVP